MESLPEDNTAALVFAEYEQVVKAVIREQRRVLQKINKKEGVDEDIIRKHLSLLDMEQEKIRQLFNKEG